MSCHIRVPPAGLCTAQTFRALRFPSSDDLRSGRRFLIDPASADHIGASESSLGAHGLCSQAHGMIWLSHFNPLSRPGNVSHLVIHNKNMAQRYPDPLLHSWALLSTNGLSLWCQDRERQQRHRLQSLRELVRTSEGLE